MTANTNLSILAEVAHAFSLGRVREPATYAARGAMGEIWRLVTDRGPWALKRLFWDEQGAPEADVTVQLAAADAGIALPRPVLTRDDTVVVEVAGHRFRVYEWVDVGPAVEHPLPRGVAEEAGRYLGLLHALGLRPSDPEIDPWYTAVHGDASDWDRLERTAADARVPWAAELARHRAIVDALRSIVAEGARGPEIVCHRDYNRSNVLPRNDGTGLVVLDWDNAGPEAADAELAAALLAWASHGERCETGSLTAFFAAYADVGGPARVTVRGSFAGGVAARLNFLFVMAEQALDGGEHAQFADERVEALLGGQVSRLPRVIDELLAALAALPSAG